MGLQATSLAEFSRRLSRVSESLLSGAPLEQSAGLIRHQLGAQAIAIQIAECRRHATALHVFEERDGATSAGRNSPEERLAWLESTSRARAMASAGDGDGLRYDLWAFRTEASERFTDDEKVLCEIFVAQLRRGLELSTRLSDSEAERTVYSDVMDRLSVGVILVDGSSRILKSSPTADRLVALRDGLVVLGGRLRATDTKDDRAFQATIRAAVEAMLAGASPSPRGLTLSRSRSDRGLGVVVQPIAGDPRPCTGRPARVAVYVRDSDTPAEIESELVRQLFDLTPAEAAVARRLAAGFSLDDAAASLSISRNTARAHLRSIFSKSGISRQTELVRLMLSSAAVLGHGGRQVA